MFELKGMMSEFLDSLRKFHVDVPPFPTDPIIPTLEDLAMEPPNKEMENIDRSQLTEQEKQNLLMGRLIQTIEDNDKKSDALGRKMLVLTWVTIALTATQTIPAIDTVYCKWLKNCV